MLGALALISYAISSPIHRFVVEPILLSSADTDLRTTVRLLCVFPVILGVLLVAVIYFLVQLYGDPPYRFLAASISEVEFHTSELLDFIEKYIEKRYPEAITRLETSSTKELAQSVGGKLVAETTEIHEIKTPSLQTEAEGEPVLKPPQLTPSEKDRLERELARLNKIYDYLTRRIEGLDRNIHLTNDSEQEVINKAKRDQTVMEHDTIDAQIRTLERQLGK